MEWYLPVIWAGLIGTAVMLYVVLDGFDLGIAILFPTTKDEGERDQRAVHRDPLGSRP